MSVSSQYLKSALNISWALKSDKRIPPSERHIRCLGHTTRSREEVWQKLCLLDIFKYSINAERAGNANANGLNRSPPLMGGQVLIALWMPGTSFHSTDLLLVAYNCMSSVHISSYCLRKTGKGIELSFGCFYCLLSPIVLFFHLWICVVAQGSWKRNRALLL